MTTRAKHFWGTGARACVRSCVYVREMDEQREKGSSQPRIKKFTHSFPDGERFASETHTSQPNYMPKKKHEARWGRKHALIGYQ